MKAIQSNENDDHLLATSPDAGPDESGLIVTPSLPSSTPELCQNNGEDDGEEDGGKQEEATVGLLGNSDYKEADTGKLHEILYSVSPILFVLLNTNRQLRVY